jgi:hypothetical protein
MAHAGQDTPIGPEEWGLMCNPRRRDPEALIGTAGRLERDANAKRDEGISFGFYCLTMALVHIEERGSHELFCRAVSECFSSLSKISPDDVRVAMTDRFRQLGSA